MHKCRLQAQQQICARRMNGEAVWFSCIAAIAAITSSNTWINHICIPYVLIIRSSYVLFCASLSLSLYLSYFFFFFFSITLIRHFIHYLHLPIHEIKNKNHNRRDNADKPLSTHTTQHTYIRRGWAVRGPSPHLEDSEWVPHNYPLERTNKKKMILLNIITKMICIQQYLHFKLIVINIQTWARLRLNI